MGELAIDLKTELDRIDAECIEYASDRYYASRLRILIGMWEKGEVIANYTGGKTCAWKELARITDRSDVQLKCWHELFIKYPDKEIYIEKEAKPKALKWTQKALVEKKDNTLSQEADPIDNIDDETTINVNAGDIIKLGDHTLYCGDAYKINIKADAIITDPPYGINYEPDWKKWDGSKSDFKKIIGDTESFNPVPFMKYKTMLFFGANYYSNNLPVGGWLVWDKRIDEIKDRMLGSPFELAWFISEHTDKKAIIKRLLHGGVVNADSEIGNNEKRFHPTQKPITLLKSIIEDLTIENEIINDPFAGSGSTLIACELTGRKCIAIEIEPGYCSIIVSRWEKITGRAAEWITG